MNEILNIYPHIIWKPDTEMYDCSNRTIEEWAARGTPNPLKGWTALIFGVLAITVYILTLASITNKEFLQHPCYRMMYFTSVNDIINFFLSNIVSGYYLIVGANYCIYPKSNFLLGALVVGVLESMCVSVMALALGRLAELTEHGRCLFQGKMTWFWVLSSLIAFVFCAFFTHPLVFNSKDGAWLFHPVIRDNFQEELEVFRNHFFLLIADSIAFIITVTYMFIPIYVLCTKSRSNNPQMSRMEKNLFIQCTLISLVLCSCCYLYTAVILFEMPVYAKTVAQILYQVSECAPLFGYLLFNHSIRKKFLGTVRISSTS